MVKSPIPNNGYFGLTLSALPKYTRLSNYVFLSEPPNICKKLPDLPDVHYFVAIATSKCSTLPPVSSWQQ